MTAVKICGITSVRDALLAAEAGADLLGFIFYPPSPRYVALEQVYPMVQALRHSPFDVDLVGVFVDERLEVIREVVAGCGLDYVQLHGTEPPRVATVLLNDGVKLIKAFRVGDGTSPVDVAGYPATAYLLDSYVPGRPGGTGRTFDWTLAATARVDRPVILAGGLTPGNVAEAVRTAQPWGVDAASGVEATPGRKDPDKVRCFVEAVRSARVV